MLTMVIHEDKKWMVTGYDAIREMHKTAGCQQGKNCNGPGCKVKRVRRNIMSELRGKGIA